MIGRRALLLTGLPLLAAGTAAAAWWATRPTGPRFVELAMAAPEDIPTAIAIGRDGTVWFTLDNAAAIGRIRDGRLERLAKPGRNLEPVGLAVTPDGAAWFADLPAHALVRVDPSGAVSTVPLGTPTVRVGRIAAAPDGALWFAEGAMHSITRLVRGELTRHPVRYMEAGPFGVAVAPDGAVWASLQRANRLVRIDPAGRLEPVELPRDAPAPSDVLVRADGSVWVLSFRGNKILRYAGGRFETVEVGGESAGLSGLAEAPDGALWFAMARRGALGRLAGGRIETFRLPRERALPFDVAVDAAGDVWYTDITGFVGRLAGAGSTA